MKSNTTILMLLALPLIAAAQSDQSYECTMANLVRRVAVEREGAAPVPCEVAYYKDTESSGARQVLWSAEHDPTYCGARASEFVARLEGLGWQCMATNAESDSAISEDDAED